MGPIISEDARARPAAGGDRRVTERALAFEHAPTSMRLQDLMDHLPARYDRDKHASKRAFQGREPVVSPPLVP